MSKQRKKLLSQIQMVREELDYQHQEASQSKASLRKRFGNARLPMLSLLFVLGWVSSKGKWGSFLIKQLAFASTALLRRQMKSIL